MKKSIMLYCLFMICCVICFAQDCTNYLYMTNNAQVQIKIFDRKGNESGVQTWKVSDVKKDGSGFSSTINTSMTDSKGKEIASSTGTYKCNGGMLQADIKMAMPQEQMQAYKNTDAKVDAVYLEYPYKLSVGQSLKDADVTMDMTKSGGLSTTVSFKEVNRKVDAQEKVTTPAGTWDAYIISYDANFRAQMAGIGIPFNFHAKEWFVPGIGIVKSESYSKNDKLLGSTLLNSITK